METVGSATDVQSAYSAQQLGEGLSATEVEPIEYDSSFHLNKLKGLLKNTYESSSFHEYDERRKHVFDEYRKRMKEAPKTLVQKAEEKKPPIERQLEESDRKLAELLEFGDELVTNIKVADEKRELLRREYELDREAILKADLEKESLDSMAQFNNISARWVELDAFKEPIALFEQLEKQKENVANLMQSKDNIIAQCQAEIDRINAKYYDDQQRQANDVRCLIERIDRQTELIKMAYKSHTEMLSNTINDERQNIALAAATRWNKFYDDMLASEETKFDLAKEKEMFYAREIQRISDKQEEITRVTRIRLEKEAEQLEFELRNVKNTILINSEKLDYNYQVMQKRNEENIIINNQQKRRVARLTEGISSLKTKIADLNAQNGVKMRKYSDDIQKLHASINDLEAKSHDFLQQNKRKFDLVWAINFKEVTTLLLKTHEIDRILHEQQLAIPWKKPDIDLTDINVCEDEDSTAPVTEFPRISLSAKKKRRSTMKKKDSQLEMGLLRNILRKIADRAGFLVEEKLLKIIEPYSEDDKCLVRLDNIFIALRINDIQTVRSLTECFKPYAFCPNCSDGVSSSVMQEFYNIAREFSPGTASQGFVHSSVTTFEKPKSTAKVAEQARTCSNHYLVIEPAFVLTALNEFTKRQTEKRHVVTFNELHEGAVNLIPFDIEAIKAFWGKFANYLPREKRKLWSSLEHGLNHYLEVLKQRAQLDDECTFLRRQNQELKHLLQKFKV